MNDIARPTFGIIGPLLFLALSSMSVDAQTFEAIKISLHQPSREFTGTIRLRDVAELQHPSSILKQRVGRLDLDDMENAEVEITQSHIRIRLLLAGYRSDQFRITGQQSIVLRPSSHASYGSTLIPQIELDHDGSQILNSKFESAIRRTTAKAFSLKVDEVNATSKSTINKHEFEKLSQFDPNELEFELLDSGRDAIGNRRLRCSVNRQGKKIAILNLFAETTLIIEQPFAKVAIENRETFSHDNIVFRRSETSVAPFELLTPSRLIGKRASRRIPIGSTIKQSSIQIQQASYTQPIDMVKSRDPVSVIAKVGNVRVQLNNATALQAGALGEVVRVRNEDSKKIILCRVVGANEVETVR